MRRALVSRARPGRAWWLAGWSLECAAFRLARGPCLLQPDATGRHVKHAKRGRTAGCRHVEIADESGQAVEFPFSRGVSFYEVNDQGQVCEGAGGAPGGLGRPGRAEQVLRGRG